MAIPLTRAWRRQRIARRPTPKGWHGIIDRNVRMAHRLSGDARDRLASLAAVLVKTLRWEAGREHTVDEEMRVTIAAQAAMLELGMPGFHPFPALRTVIVYGARFMPPDMRVPVLGQAHLRGPVILSWADALEGARGERDGRNVVLHEFAHNLDMLDGWVDGTPPLETQTQEARWVEVMTHEYNELRRATMTGEPTLLDKYGATNPAEFFAVSTEAFFEMGHPLRSRHPSLYAVLARYYRQDPAGWPDAAG